MPFTLQEGGEPSNEEVKDAKRNTRQWFNRQPTRQAAQPEDVVMTLIWWKLGRPIVKLEHP